ncbi:probable enoyl-CoA hydratase echA8 [Lytechinus variegatus]|uniref:probable enoyl-CoA hydratase echA8 n=1 Tax=Lytechinus variegatus TaxID=7654 RepID=UPI001BB2C6D1|nr:probable enoyl-CoA hydratase echA8 [Lytechinus variegatus]XP_041468522.1 probable enoyl-CoA hydratase echA8 [Lytechinus variegatus]
MVFLQRFRSFLPNAAMRVGVRYCSSGSLRRVEVEREDKICLIGINRPDVRNAVDPETAKQLQVAFCRFEEDPELSVAVLYGKGGNFCAGWDLKNLAKQDPETVADSLQPGPMGPTAMQFSKPVIGAVSGYAVAGGMELALICDLRVAEKSSIMGVFNRRFGVPLIDGCTVRLPKIIGLSRALDLILTGRPVDADEALGMGLVNRVVPDGQALTEAKKLAKLLTTFPDQRAMLGDRHATLRNTYDSQGFEEAIKYEFERGVGVIAKESVKGAGRFADGQGRKGSYEDFKSKL